jgi:ribosomal protein S18 acetylase RimI-like enzyme
MMNFAIREMTIADFEEVKLLWQHSNGIELSSADTKESIARFLERNPGLSFVARDGDQLVGAVLCGHDGRRGYIDHLAVSQSHRCQGIGRALVGRCLYNLVQIGIRKWHLFVMQDNQDAIEFWRKLGWAQRVELVTMSKYNSS